MGIVGIVVVWIVWIIYRSLIIVRIWILYPTTAGIVARIFVVEQEWFFIPIEP